MLDKTKDYLYDEKLDLLTKKFNHTHKSIEEIIFVEDLFHDGIKSTRDILNELRKLKDLKVEFLKLKFNEDYADVPLKRIFGLAAKDNTYYDMYGIGYHNPQYPIADFYLDLIKTLTADLMWEEGF